MAAPANIAATAGQIQAALSAHGLRLRGGWQPGGGDALPSLPGGQTAAVVWMVGVVGSAFWPFFKASRLYQDGLPDPLDRWSRAIGTDLAQRWGGVALFPFDGPPRQPSFYPFQQWASRAEPLQTSPLMLRIHPEHGLWHAYRFALALPAMSPGDALITADGNIRPQAAPDICLRCTGQPCLSACPVQAFTGTAYQVDACAAHLHTPAADDCNQAGCLARRACPVGVAERYVPEHAAFHMTAFLRHR